jgi:hypothetical protein
MTMNQYPEAAQRLHDAIRSVPGVKDVELGIRKLEGIAERELSLPGEFGDLPHVALRRTHGGQKDELLVTAEVWLRQTFEGWIALEFLAWWVRDLSRGGEVVQLRPLALPPVAYGTQLGRTLKFAIEFFFVNPGDDIAPVLERLSQVAESLSRNVEDYRDALSRPTRADHGDLDSLRQSAENEDASAQLTLGRCYELGQGVPADAAEAFRWYQRAADHGHPRAKMFLGLCYAEGKATAQDHVRALACYREAAEGGLAFACGLVGLSYASGKGIEQSDTEAANWYRRGAEAGEPSCMAQLGECYEQGKGVEPDPRQALHWYRAALGQGFKHVEPAIARVEADLASAKG